jgi:hypothetical protein
MAALVVERRGGLLKSLATEQQLFEVVARPRLASLIDVEGIASVLFKQRYGRTD